MSNSVLKSLSYNAKLICRQPPLIWSADGVAAVLELYSCCKAVVRIMRVALNNPANP